MPAREFAMIVQEKEFGVPVAVADRVLGVNAWYIRLDTDNAFSMQSKPTISKTPMGGGYNVPGCKHSDQWTTTGSLQGLAYPGDDGLYAKFLADVAFTRINTARTVPWTTTDAGYVMPPEDLASFAVYHAILDDDGTYERKLYNGIKVTGGSFDVSDQDPRALRFNFNIQGKRDDLNQAQAALAAAGSAYTPAAPNSTEFPFPAAGDYVCGPYVMSDTVGLLKIETARSMYSSISLSFTNSMAPKWWEEKYLKTNRWCGRDVKLNVTLKRKKSPDDQAAFRALMSHETALEFNNGQTFLKFDLGAANAWDDLTRSLPIGDEYVWTGVLQNYWDDTLGESIVVTGGLVEEEP